jgi:hypothetical protein
MLRSNLVGTLLAFATLAPAGLRAEGGWEPIEAPTVTLLDAGEAPRRALRYALPGASWRVVRQQRYLASVKLPLRGSREDAGQFSFDFTARSLAPTGSEPLEIAVELHEAVGRSGAAELLVGAAGRIRFSDRGLPVSAVWSDLPAAGDADGLADRMLLERFQTRVSHLPTPMPEEDVGAGAKWEIRQTLTQGTSSFAMIARCTLVEDREDGLDLQCRYSHDADATTFQIGQAGRQRKVEIQDSDVTGQSLLLQSLDTVVPTREDGALETFFDAKVRMGLAPIRIKVTSEENWSQHVPRAD